MLGGLLHLKHTQGFEPKTVIDVGAALGTFELYDAFPLCRHFMIEPILENEPHLAKLCSKLPNADYMMGAAASKSGIAELRINPELVHSSVTEVYSRQHPSSHPEADTDPCVRKVTAVTLDEICQQYGLEPPYLIKLDVDGNEPDVLLGATQTLQDTEYLIIEVSLFGQIHQVIDLMRSQGFVIYDICDLAYRPGDAALWQADMAFVKEEGQFRQSKCYTPDAQEEGLNSHLRAWREQYIQAIDELQPSDYNPLLNEDPVNLRAINLLVRPDWKTDETVLIQQLLQFLRTLLRHPEKHQMAVLITAEDVEVEAVDLLLANLMMVVLEEIEVDESEGEPDIILINSEQMLQLKSAAPRMTAQILVGCDRPPHPTIAVVQTTRLEDLEQTRYSIS